MSFLLNPFRFTVPGGALPATFIQRTTPVAPTTTANVRESNALTVGSGPNRVILAMIQFGMTANTDVATGTTVTWGASGRTQGTGTAMDIIASEGLDGTKRRTRIIWAILINPPSGAGTVQVQYKDGSAAAVNTTCSVLTVSEWNDANQTLANYTAGGLTNGNSGTNVTSRTTSLTTLLANTTLLTAVCVLSGDFTNDLAVSGGSTLTLTDRTGTTNTSDITVGLSTEVVAAAQADGNGWTWGVARDGSILSIGIPPA